MSTSLSKLAEHYVAVYYGKSTTMNSKWTSRNSNIIFEHKYQTRFITFPLLAAPLTNPLTCNTWPDAVVVVGL